MSTNHTTDRRLVMHFAYAPQFRPSGIASAVYTVVEAQRNQENVDIGLIIVTDSKLDENGSRVGVPRGKWLQGIRQLKNYRGPRVAILHGVFCAEVVATHFLLRIFRIPYIVVSHGGLSDDVFKKSPKMKSLWRKLLLDPMLKHATAVQFITEAEMKSSIVSDTSKVILSHHLIEAPSCVASAPGRNSPTTILFIGRLATHHKGLDLLLDALHVVHKESGLEDVRVLIAGPDHDNGLENLQITVAKTGLDDIVEFSPAIYGEAKEELLCQADIFVHTSRFEAEPIAVLEAMIHGLPVIVTRGTNMVEIVRDNELGWACETNVEEIAECLVESLKLRDDWVRRGQNASQWMKENRSPDGVIAELLDDYFAKR